MPRTPHPQRYTKAGQVYIRVKLAGKHHHVGRADDPISMARAHAMIAEYLAAGRPQDFDASASHQARAGEIVPIVSIAADFLEWAAETHHRNRQFNYERALKLLAPWALKCASEFHIEHLIAIRDGSLKGLVSSKGRPLSYSTLCDYFSILKQFFGWAYERRQQYGVPDEWPSFASVKMWPNRGQAPKRRRVSGVSKAHIDAACEHLPVSLQRLVRIQEATGRRSGELISLRATDLDRSRKPWRAIVEAHKTAHSTGEELVIMFGPQARAILEEVLAAVRSPHEPLFPNSKGEPYTSTAYRQEIQKACARATWLTWTVPQRRTWAASYTDAGGVLPKRFDEAKTTSKDVVLAIVRHAMGHGTKVIWWHPHQLRHNAEQRAEKRFRDVGAGKTMLGNRTLDATQYYRQQHEAALAEIVEKVG